jgi:S-adenosylmethionine hydrolase
MPLTALGSLIGDILRLPVLKLSNTPPNTVTGEVIFIDHFGNLMTNIGLLTWKSPQVLILDEPTVPVKRDISALQSLVAYEDHHVAGIRSTYGMSSVGDLLALVNSDGYLELAINQGNAAEHLAARVGDKVRLILPS